MSAYFQESSIDLLCRGYVNSYIKFFHSKSYDFSQRQFDELKQLLTAVEDALRMGNYELIYKAKTDVARFFSSNSQFSESLTYFSEALDAAKRVNNKNAQHEVDAKCNLGSAVGEAGDWNEALQLFENARELSRNLNYIEGEKKSLGFLLHTHMSLANQETDAGNPKEAIPHYTKCIELIKFENSTSDASMYNNLLYCLGKSSKEIGECEKAVSYLEQFLERVKLTEDRVNEGNAQLILAECYEQLNKKDHAISYLEVFIESQTDSTQKEAEAKACKQLGMLYNKIEKHDLSSNYFDRHYQLLKTITPSSHMQVESAMVQLGVAKANSKMQFFFETIADPKGVSAIIQFKEDGSFGDYLPPAHRVTIQ
ncbi:Tetratricopeptide repeat protein 29 [Terramyces sp. JEL0728]|nr:Tetratricopeptide repeat protein 29 [Terramyces sp. JEL0728]